MGIKLFNKLPNSIKKVKKKPQDLKKKLKKFLLQHVFYSVDEYMSFKELLPLGKIFLKFQT